MKITGDSIKEIPEGRPNKRLPPQKYQQCRLWKFLSSGSFWQSLPTNHSSHPCQKCLGLLQMLFQWLASDKQKKLIRVKERNLSCKLIVVNQTAKWYSSYCLDAQAWFFFFFFFSFQRQKLWSIYVANVQHNTWLCTALSIAGPICSRTSLPLRRLAITSICTRQITFKKSWGKLIENSRMPFNLSFQGVCCL